MENTEKEFIKGFNTGYQLSKHDPDLLKQLTKSEANNSDYFKALALGAKQHDREKLLDQLKQSSKKNKGKDLDM